MDLLVKENIQDIYLLSPLQEGMYYHAQLDPHSSAYLQQFGFHLTGDVSLDALQRTVDQLFKRYDVLRTVFIQRSSRRVHQIVLKQASPTVRVVDLTGNPGVNEQIAAFKEKDRSLAFDLGADLLVRVAVLKTGPQSFQLIWTYHHILMDGWCLPLIFSDFNHIYASLIRQQPADLRPVRPFRTFIDWLSHQPEEEALGYWTKYLQDYQGIPNLASGKAASGYQHGEQFFHCDETATTAVTQLASAAGVTINTLLHGLWGILISKYTGVRDLVFGTVVSGRPPAIEDIGRMVGLFINTIPVRIRIDDSQPLLSLLKEVQQQAGESLPYHHCSLAKIQAGTPLKSQLFDHLVVFENYPVAEASSVSTGASDGYEVDGFSIFEQTNYNLNIVASLGNQLRIRITFNSNTYNGIFIDMLGRQLCRLLATAARTPGINVKDLAAGPGLHMESPLFLEALFPADATIHSRVQQMAATFPDRVAIVNGNNHLTYQALDQQSDKVAAFLRQQGITRESIVALMTHRSEKAIVAMLGILKAGGAYLPIAPDLPAERVQYIISDSRPAAVLTDKPSASADLFGSPIFHLDDERIAIADTDRKAEAIDPKTEGVDPNDIAYIIYTSGTTGRPKGVMITHRNVIRLLINDRFQFDFDKEDTWTLFHNFNFDFSVWEMYGPLFFGGKLIVVPATTAIDPVSFAALAAGEKVTVLNQTPAAFYNLSLMDQTGASSRLATLRYVIFGGEALSPGKLAHWARSYPRCKLINMFGITETTVHVTYKEITAQDIENDYSNIGRPIPTMGMYIAGEDLAPLPPFAIGELCIYGEGLARGYLNQPELTAERFVTQKDGRRLYRSGDHAQMIETGEAIYRGRIDDQVKVRGYRIELREIASALMKAPGVKDICVITRTDSMGIATLVAYFVPDGAGTEASLLRKHAGSRLPAYMVPAHFIRVQAFPLTANGKIDKRRLPDPADVLTQTARQPLDETQQQILSVWLKVLQLEKIDVHQSFFAIGGDSIKAVRMIGGVNELLGSRLGLASVYEHDTIAALHASLYEDPNFLPLHQLQQAEQEITALRDQVLSGSEATKDSLEDAYPMSDIEKGMIFYQLRGNPEEAVYIDQFTYQLPYHDFDFDAFSLAFRLLSDKHAILRTGFNLTDFEEPMQLVYHDVQPDLQQFDYRLQNETEQRRQIESFMLRNRARAFDLVKPPLYRMTVFLLGERGIFIVWTFHHAILDGWSNASLITELNNTYLQLRKSADYRPAGLRSTYRHFVAETRARNAGADTRQFWQQHVLNARRFKLPGSSARPEGNKTGRLLLDLGAEPYLSLETLCHEHDLVLKHVLFAVYAYALGMFQYESDFTVGLVTSSRPTSEDGDKVLGCFLNTVPVNVHLPASASWLTWLKDIDALLRKMKRHEWMSLYEIARQAGEKPSHENPFFDVLFNYVDFHIYRDAREVDGTAGPGLSIEGYENTNTMIDFIVNVTFGQLFITINYDESFISPPYADRLSRYVQTLLGKITDSPAQPAEKASLFNSEDRQQLSVLDNTQVSFPASETNVSLFQHLVEQHGKPIPGLQILLLDENHNIQPPGTPGEIFVGGKGLARSYLNQPELTGRKYRTLMGQRWYASGDLAILLPSGGVEYLGRIDRLVKDRGLRIDPNAITSANAATSTGAASTTAARSAVPQQAASPLTTPADVPQTTPADDPLESSLTAIWETVLKVKPIGVNDNYFHIGGDSIKAIRLLSIMNERLGLKVTIAELYAGETIARLATTIREKTRPQWHHHLDDARSEIEAIRNKILDAGTLPDPDAIEDIYPLSDIQSGMLFHHLKDEGALYHDQMIHQLSYPDFDTGLFRDALSIMTARHPILRTGFDLAQTEGPVQIVYKQVEVPLNYYDLRDKLMQDQELFIRRFLEQDRAQLFDFSAAPLWRLSIFQTTDNSIVVLFVCHHAILDGWSDASFNTELHNIYTTLKKGKDYPWSPLRATYKDFVIQQLALKHVPERLTFWEKELEDFSKLGFLSATAKNATGAQCTEFNPDPGKDWLPDLKAAAMRHGTSVRTISMAAYLGMLNMLTRDGDILAGYVTSNRPLQSDGEKILGCFLNTLPIRLLVPHNLTWSAFLRTVDEKLKTLKPAEAVSLADIVHHIQPLSTTENPLFDTIFNYVDFHVYQNLQDIPDTGESGTGQGLKLSGRTVTNTPLGLTVDTTHDQYSVSFNFYDGVLDLGQVQRLSGYYFAILENIAHNETAVMSKQSILSQAEKHKLLVDFNRCDEPVPANTTVVELIRQQIAQNPFRKAVICGEQTLYFRQLSQHSARVSATLTARIPGKGGYIPILMSNCLALPVAILGVLRSGHAFALLDISWPPARISEVVRQLNAPMLLVNEAGRELIGNDPGLTTLAHDILLDEQDPVDDTWPETRQDTAMFVVYTSGTTREPKGAINHHAGIFNRFLYMNKRYGIRENDKVLMTCNPAFDSAVWQLLWPLTNGIPTVIPVQEKHTDILHLVDLVGKEKITITGFVPSVFNVLTGYLAAGHERQRDNLRSLRQLEIGGEVMDSIHIYRFRQMYPDITISNAYGPCECSIGTVFYEVAPDFADPIPIGQPIDNVECLVLDTHHDLMPVGAIGELYLGGVCAGLGYVGDPKLTDEKFIFLQFDDRSPRRFYKTGDLVWYAPDGTLTYWGRTDQQVKINGVRIELNEVVSRLLSHPQIREAFVAVDGEKDRKYLVAWYVSSEPIAAETIRDFLTPLLPPYMIPAHFVWLPKMPLTSNGKLDRNNLTVPLPGTAGQVTPPRHEPDKALVKIWSEILSYPAESIGIDGNFFELGGHSLNAIVMVTWIRHTFGVNLPLKVLYLNPTIKALADFILRSQANATAGKIPVAAGQLHYALSHAQRRLYVLQQREPGSTGYHITRAFRIGKELTPDLVRPVIQQLMLRHESLRTSVEMIDGQPRQVIHESVPFSLEFHAAVPDDFVRPFDLSTPPLFRVAWIAGDDSEHLLLIDVHHIIADGISLDLLRKDFDDFLAKRTPRPIPIGYKDFAEWQQRRAADPKGREFWRTHLTGASFELHLPYDAHDLSDDGRRRSGLHSFTLNATQSASLKQLTRYTGTTPFTILLAIYQLLLSKLTGRLDVTTGVVVAGRSRWQVQNIAGIFTNTLPLRSQWTQDMPFAEWIRQFRDYVLQALDFEEEDIESLTGQLLEEGHMAYHGGYNAMFTLNFDDSSDGPLQEAAEAKLTPIAFSPAQTICDLVLTANVRQDAYHFTFQYDAGRFSVATIRRIASHFVQLIDQLTANAWCAYKDIQIQHSLLQADLSEVIGLLSEISW